MDFYLDKKDYSKFNAYTLLHKYNKHITNF